MLCAPILSPMGLVVWAVFVALGFAVVHTLGWRDHTTFLSGTPASAGGGAHQSEVRGMTYLALYFAVVLPVPIMGIAAGLLVLIDAWMYRRNATQR